MLQPSGFTNLFHCFLWLFLEQLHLVIVNQHRAKCLYVTILFVSQSESSSAGSANASRNTCNKLRKTFRLYSTLVIFVTGVRMAICSTVEHCLVPYMPVIIRKRTLDTYVRNGAVVSLVKWVINLQNIIKLRFYTFLCLKLRYTATLFMIYYESHSVFTFGFSFNVGIFYERIFFSCDSQLWLQ